MLEVSRLGIQEDLMPYRLEHITVEERVAVGCACLLCAGEYGVVTHLAHELGTSRQFLYDLRARAQEALERAVAPGTPGRPAPAGTLSLDRAAVSRAILVLSQVAHASVRGIQECLREMLGVERSVGAIQAVLTEAAQRAEAVVPVPAAPLQVAADEVFAAGAPVLEVVEPRSGLIVALERAQSRDETTWGCTWLDLAARGVQAGGGRRRRWRGRAAGGGPGRGPAGAPAGSLAHAARPGPGRALPGDGGVPPDDGRGAGC